MNACRIIDVEYGAAITGLEFSERVFHFLQYHAGTGGVKPAQTFDHLHIRKFIEHVFILLFVLITQTRDYIKYILAVNMPDFSAHHILVRGENQINSEIYQA